MLISRRWPGGYQTIAEIFGEKVAAKAAEWLGYKSGSDGAAYASGEAGDDDLDDLVEATKADRTAPLLPEAVKRLAAFKKNDPAGFAVKAEESPLPRDRAR